MSKTCSIGHHPITPHPSFHAARQAAATIQWPSFTGTATLVGESPSGDVTVYVDASLGSQATQNASDLLAAADTVVAKNNALFGSTGGPVNVIVFALGGATDGTGGADHMACDYSTGQNIEVDCSYGQSQRCVALFEAELSECAMGGNLCGESTGEALSRWCTMAVAGDVLEDFASAPVWAQDGMPNWVDTMEPTDQDYDSIGCGMAFISWLQSQNITFAEIARGMVTLGDNGTLSQLYNKLGLGPTTNAWTKFLAAVKALTGRINNDDPFNALHPTPTPVPTPTPTPTPTPVPTPTPTPSAMELGYLIVEAVIAALVAQQTASQLKATVQAILNQC